MHHLGHPIPVEEAEFHISKAFSVVEREHKQLLPGGVYCPHFGLSRAIAARQQVTLGCALALGGRVDGFGFCERAMLVAVTCE